MGKRFGHLQLHSDERVPAKHAEFLPQCKGDLVIFLTVHRNRVMNRDNGGHQFFGDPSDAVGQALIVMDNIVLALVFLQIGIRAFAERERLWKTSRAHAQIFKEVDRRGQVPNFFRSK